LAIPMYLAFPPELLLITIACALLVWLLRKHHNRLLALLWTIRFPVQILTLLALLLLVQLALYSVLK